MSTFIRLENDADLVLALLLADSEGCSRRSVKDFSDTLVAAWDY